MSMTIETRTTIQLSDIRAIEFECRSCHCRIVRPMGGTQPIMPVCPECGVTWMQYKGTMEFLSNFASQVPKAATIDAQNDGPFVVRFEVSTEKK